MTSASPTPSSDFFGLRPAAWPAQWRGAWSLLLQWRGLRAFTPTVRVRLLQADGRVSDWDMASDLAHAAAPGATTPAAAQAAIWAVELPRERVLERRLVLPLLAPAELEQAIELEVAAFTPFGIDQTVHGYRVVRRAQQTEVDLVLAQRQDVERCLQATLPDTGAAAAAAPEVWVLPADAGGQVPDHLVPITLSRGEPRQRRISRGRALRLALFGLVLALLAALAVTPTAQLRLRAIGAQQAFDALRQQTEAQQARRDALMQRAEQFQRVRELTAEQLALVPVFSLLTDALPDGAWLQVLRVEGGKVQMAGSADDTSALVQALGGVQGVQAVRLPAPVTRGRLTDKESFTLEISFDPAALGTLVQQEAQ